MILNWCTCRKFSKSISLKVNGYNISNFQVWNNGFCKEVGVSVLNGVQLCALAIGQEFQLLNWLVLKIFSICIDTVSFIKFVLITSCYSLRWQLKLIYGTLHMYFSYLTLGKFFLMTSIIILNNTVCLSSTTIQKISIFDWTKAEIWKLFIIRLFMGHSVLIWTLRKQTKIAVTSLYWEQQCTMK